jgi:hypothetical protein
MITKLLFSKKEAAHSLSISPRSVEYLISRKELVTRRIGARVLVTAASVERFARQDHPQPVAKQSPAQENRHGDE